MLPGIGIFGTGNIVKVIIAFLQSKGFRVEALWGRTLSMAKELATEMNVTFYTSHIDDVLLCKDVGLVIVMCSPNLHSQIAVKALGIGKHVLCDKPGGLSQNEMLKMVHAAQYYPSLISILAHGLRFLPAFMQLHKLVQQNCYVGQVKICDVQVHMDSLVESNYNWLCDDTMGGGVLSLIGSHIIDIITHVINQRAVRVQGLVRTFSKTTDQVNGIRSITSNDFATFQMEMDGGALVTVTLNTHVPGSFSQNVLICGSKGYLVVRDTCLYGFKNGSQKEEALLVDPDDLPSTASNFLPKPYLKGLLKMITSLREAFSNAPEERKGWQKGPVALAASFDDGQYVHAVIDAIKKSSLERQWLNVNVITEEPDPNPILSSVVRRSAISM